MKTTIISLVNVQIKLVKILLTIFAIIFILSCNDKEELILESTILHGTWVEVEPKDLIQFVGQNHTFIFREDSFFLKIEYWTDIGNPEDTCGGCQNFGYAKGEYFFDFNTINFNGKYGFDSNFSKHNDDIKLYDYNISFNYKLKSSKTIVLNPESEYDSITLIKE